MRAASAFWIPATRPAVIVLLLLVLGSISVLLLAVADPDFPTRAVDVGLLAILLYAGATGHLAGASLRDLQHCRFTWVLPGVRSGGALRDEDVPRIERHPLPEGVQHAGRVLTERFGGAQQHRTVGQVLTQDVGGGEPARGRGRGRWGGLRHDFTSARHLL